MILFFYGEDNYRLKKKVQALKEKFVSASLGDTNLVVLDGETLKYDEFIRQILAMPFLSKTRLVIIENILKNAKKEVLERIPDSLKKVPTSTVLVFSEEGVPDRRTALFKRLSKEKFEEFKVLEPNQLVRWIEKECEMRNVKCDREVTTKLVEYVGPDLWRMGNELDKLTAYRLPITEKNSVNGERITVNDVELLVKPQIQADIFRTIDAVAQKNIKTAIFELYKLLDTGTNELMILTMIVYQYRNLLIVKDIFEKGDTNQWAIAKKAKLHPFVVQKSLALIRQYSMDNLKKIYRKLLDYDFKIKTGKIESRAALELLIYELTTQT